MPNDSEETIEDLILVDETPLAILVDNSGHQVWIPRSQVRLLSKKPKQDGVQMIEITIPEWLARRELLA